MKDNQVSLGFNNTASGLNGARYSAAGSTQFFLSQSPEEIYNNPQTNLDPMIDPLLAQDSDILSFSEIFGLRQRDYLREKLEKRGYTVYATNAFEMWSQSVEGEHLYNVVGIHEERIGSPKRSHHEFRNTRKIAGLALSARYLFSDAVGEGSCTKVDQAKNIYNRLARGILDGAISTFDFDNFTLATGHVHKFSEAVGDILADNISEKPFILLGDMNVPHGKEILLNPPFNTPDWESLVHPETRTFGFVDGLDLRDRFTLATAHMQPDVLIVKGIKKSEVIFYQTPSDHNGVGATLEFASY